ncbi:MAG: hypothetical protein WAL26_27100, partial [Mycobacterium sp.]
YHPRPIIGFGFSMLAIAMTWLSVEMTPTTPIWRIVLPLTATGIGMAFIWSPLAATATRNLASDVAGAGSGVYNATRQVGSVLGSASMAAFMTTRISAEMPLAADGPGGEGSVTQLPGFLHEPFAAAMSQSLLLPAFVALFGVVAAMFLLGFAPAAQEPRRPDPVDEYWDDGHYVDDDHYVEFTVMHDDPEPVAAAPVASVAPVAPVVPVPPAADVRPIDDEGDTEPLAARNWGHHPPEGQGEHLPTPPADTWHDEPVEAWHSLLEDDEPEPATLPPLIHAPPVVPAPPVEHTPADEPSAPPDEPTEPPAYRREPVGSLLDFLADVPPPSPSVEPIGFAHNGFHTDDEHRFQPLSRFEAREEPQAHAEPQKPDVLSPDYPLDIGSHARYESPDEAGFERPSRHGLADDEPTSNGRHSRAEPDDASSRGRHYRRD